MNDPTETAVSLAETTLKQFLAHESDELLKTLRMYVWRGGLAEGTAVTDSANELLQEVVVEALNHADRFQPDKPAKAWLLGIAANLVKRRQTAVAKQAKREPLARDLNSQDMMADDALFDRLTAVHSPSHAGQYEMNERVTAVLGQLSTEEQHTITCAILLEMDGKALAQTLGVKTGTARMRLHRALNHLRQIWLETEGEEADNHD